jgi:hypothetical protein
MIKLGGAQNNTENHSDCVFSISTLLERRFTAEDDNSSRGGCHLHREKPCFVKWHSSVTSVRSLDMLLA